MTLYKFNKLSEKLDELNYPKVTESRFEIVRKDLTEEELRGNVIFRNDGIYLTINGVEHKGYMYIKKPNIARYGNPRFHITNCPVIVEQRNNNNFNGHYFWHNSNTVNLTDRSTNVLHENVILSLCSKCRAIGGINNYNDIQGFFNLLDIQDRNTNFNAETDMYVYIKEWRQISTKFRIENEYTCTKCSIKIEHKLDQRYIQVHHINGNKLQNHRDNLECLCCLCHANVDQRHINNFQKKVSAAEIKSFVKKYKNELLALDNIYIIEYLRINII